MTSVDEAEASMKLVGSRAHWRKLCSLKWFIKGRPDRGLEGLEKWRLDMAARDATVAKRVLMETCLSGNVTAAKALDAKSKVDAKTAEDMGSIKGSNKGSSYVRPTEDDSDVVDFLEALKDKKTK